ncbi:ATPases associated with a variety of cellular activities, partial [Friedmanniomyces endolithicus]
DTIDNYVSSLMLSIRQPFRANDHVKIDSWEGRVVRLTSRATVLMTLDGNHLRVPNSTVFKAVIVNFTTNPTRRFSFEVGIDPAADPATARAVALDPELIMYDEPFAGLDPISMGVTANLIRNLNDALGSTSILVSHDVHECFAIADYVYFMSAGKIVAEGTPDDLRVSEDPYVKQFVNAAPDGPVPFHYPGSSLADDLGLGART